MYGNSEGYFDLILSNWASIHFKDTSGQNPKVKIVRIKLKPDHLECEVVSFK